MSFIILVPIIVFGFVLLIGLIATKSQSSQRNAGPRPNRDAMAILDERFAKGEIDEAEYTRKKTVLRR